MRAHRQNQSNPKCGATAPVPDCLQPRSCFASRKRKPGSSVSGAGIRECGAPDTLFMMSRPVHTGRENRQINPKKAVYLYYIIIGKRGERALLCVKKHANETARA